MFIFVDPVFPCLQKRLDYVRPIHMPNMIGILRVEAQGLEQNGWNFADDISKIFSWMELIVLLFKVHCSLFIRVQLIISIGISDGLAPNRW